jgi:hypothetical protein
MRDPGTAGCFGKLRSNGDFVTRRLPESFVGPWDAMLQAGLIASRDTLGAAWLEAYLTAPLWCFALGGGVMGGPGGGGTCGRVGGAGSGRCGGADGGKRGGVSDVSGGDRGKGGSTRIGADDDKDGGKGGGASESSRGRAGGVVCGDSGDDASGTAWVGVLMPSVDRVGRHFPLAIAAPIPADAVADWMPHAGGWFARCRELALATLLPNARLADFDAGLIALSQACDPRNACGACDAPPREAGTRGLSAWWAERALRVASGLPDAGFVAALFDGGVRRDRAE